MHIHRCGPGLSAVAVLFATASIAAGHVRITPPESAPGATQRYTMRVPTERDTPTVRIELECPPDVTLVSFEEVTGWKIEQKKDSQGKITGAVWSGGPIPFAEYREFHFDAKNPATEAKLEWKVVQIYQDGTRSEWTGPENSRTPSPVTTIKK